MTDTKTIPKTADPAEKPPGMKRRRQQRSVDTRGRIIAAALSEFAKYGFDASSTRGIAQAAGVAHSLVLHHFQGKDELWHATVLATVDMYMSRVHLPSSDADLSAAAQLRGFFADYVRFSASHPDFFRMITQENTLDSERLHWLVEHHVNANAERLCKLIAAAQAEGAFVAGDPLLVLYCFLGAATGPYRSAAEIRLVAGREANDPQSIEAHVALCESLFFRD